MVRSGGIRIEAGKVVDLGSRIRTGVDLGGAWISPGFVDAGCTLGLVKIGLEDGSKDDKVKDSWPQMHAFGMVTTPRRV